MTTWCPALIKVSATWLPMKPAPPVTSTFIGIPFGRVWPVFMLAFEISLAQGTMLVIASVVLNCDLCAFVRVLIRVCTQVRHGRCDTVCVSVSYPKVFGDIARLAIEFFTKHALEPNAGVALLQSAALLRNGRPRC